LIFNIGSPLTAGDVVGTLPNPVIFTNSTPFNDYFQQLTFGSSISFIVSLYGPALSSPNGTSTAGSTFGVGLYDSNQSPILTDQISGFAGELDVNLDGSIAVLPFANGRLPSVFSASTTLPEPGAGWLLGLGVASLAAIRRARRG